MNRNICIKYLCGMMESTILDCLSSIHSPLTSVLNSKSSIVNPPTSILLYPTSILHHQIFFLNPWSKLQDIGLKMSSKYHNFQQNVRKHATTANSFFQVCPSILIDECLLISGNIPAPLINCCNDVIAQRVGRKEQKVTIW